MDPLLIKAKQRAAGRFLQLDDSGPVFLLKDAPIDLDRNLHLSEALVDRRRPALLVGPQAYRGALPRYAAIATPRRNVVGVGIGRRGPGRDSEPVVRFYVERKLPDAALTKSDRLPEEIDGFRTQVVETGLFYANTGGGSLQARARPAHPGCSVGFKLTGARAKVKTAGSLGCLVTKRGDLFILSANHVLADENRLKKGSGIFQPGLRDGGGAADRIATLAEFVPLVTTGVAADCAIAKVDDKALVDAAFPRPIGRLKSAVPIAAKEAMRVEKIGRTTNHTTGQIIDVMADVRVSYDIGSVLLQDQILIEGDDGAFSDAGDSGAVIVDRRSKRATGLLCGASLQGVTIANHLEVVLAATGCQLYT